MPRVLCLLSARNLGDAVMHAGALDALCAAGFAERYLVWTFPAAAFLFAGRPGVQVELSNFPMGATRDAFLRHPESFWTAVRALRQARPTHTLDLIGDVRERGVAALLGARIDVSPAWPPGHPFRHHVRGAGWRVPGRGQRPVPIPLDMVNVYHAQRRVLEALTGQAMPDAEGPMARRPGPGGPRTIGIHPYASAPFKLWPRARWRTTLADLRAAYPAARLVLFGTPADREDLARLAAEAGVTAETFTASLPAFYERVGGLDILIGLDSFAVHVAHRQGIPAVTLVGPNDPAIWTPPTATAVTHYGRCPYQPCYGRTRCEHTAFEYACMRAIEPAQVAAAVVDLVGPSQQQQSLS